MTKSAMAQLLEIMQQLRDPQTGCPWDIKQTFESIVPHTLEEAYEVADAIEKGDLAGLKSELGDLLFQVIFYSQLAKEQQLFDFNDVVNTLNEKLVRRHPHVFSDEAMTLNDSQLAQQWQAIKAQERQALQPNGEIKAKMFDTVLPNLPALSRANKIQQKVAALGFDWPEISGAFAKVQEEVEEVAVEINDNPYSDKTAEELGDLLFAVVNVARHGKHDPEQLLRNANRKFCLRFEQVEDILTKQGISLETATLTQMDEAWEQVKRSNLTQS